MPIVDVPSLGRVEFPDGMSESDMAAAIRQALTPERPADGFWSNAAKAAGMGITDLGRGLKQRVMEFGNAIGDVSDEALAANQGEVDVARAMGQPVLDAPGGSTGYTLGQAAIGLPAAFVPGANTYAGAAALGALYGAAQPTAENESAAANAAIGGAAGLGGQGLSNLFGTAARRWLGGRSAANQALIAQNAVRNGQIEDAIQAGYRLPPAATNPDSLTANFLQGIGGKQATAQRATQVNQPVTDRLARQALGLADDAPLTEAAVRRQINRWLDEGYRPIRQAGEIRADAQFNQGLVRRWQSATNLGQDFPGLDRVTPEVEAITADLGRGRWDANNIVEAIRRYRFEAAENAKALGNPDRIALSRFQRAAANELEELIDRNLQARGQPDLIQAFRETRTKIAQANDVLDALRPDGHVEARVIGNKAMAGDPLTGPLRTIGETEALFRRQSLTTNPLAVPDSAPMFSPLDWATAAITAGGLAGSGNPGWLAAALPLARPAARGAALSGPFQSRFAVPAAPTLGLPGFMSGLLDQDLTRHALRVGGPLGLLTSE